jgi:Na+-transporting NADH:ubiquinone oxidoreductase subunit NqrC
MPKFIWVSEFYDKKKYKEQEKKALALIVLDATEANRESIDALIFAGYPDRCVCVNENDFVTLQYKFENYRYYSNLK